MVEEDTAQSETEGFAVSIVLVAVFFVLIKFGVLDRWNANGSGPLHKFH